ncbi:three component ABC system middle component [Bradyrhizobium sp. HKCCYLS3077]|uniref:three component ABC system middle component n=1 Tax=Bradyrhizobium sp. HKCCYLS3077 TaxID=3420761 RepID=UPI003EB6ECFF
MVGRTSFELAWRDRPQEEAAHFNPAFCGELLFRAVNEFRQRSDLSMPLPYTFVILPLVLHPVTRRALPGRADTAFASWAAENETTLSVLPDRILRLRPVTRESLLFLSQHEAIGIGPDGVIVGARPIRLSAKPSSTTDEVHEIRRAAGLLGRWLSNQGGPAAVLQTFGVRV